MQLLRGHEGLFGHLFRHGVSAGIALPRRRQLVDPAHVTNGLPRVLDGPIDAQRHVVRRPGQDLGQSGRRIDRDPVELDPNHRHLHDGRDRGRDVHRSLYRGNRLEHFGILEKRQDGSPSSKTHIRFQPIQLSDQVAQRHNSPIPSNSLVKRPGFG